jgi:Coenzyme PQQ synthesis protein D (PqqD)
MFHMSNAVRRTKSEDGGVLLDVLHGRMFCLNVVGSRIIDLLEQGFDSAQVAAQISAAYDMNIETVTADVRDFIEHLNKHHILEVRDPAATSGQVSPI